jgi:hypothetical protein
MHAFNCRIDLRAIRYVDVARNGPCARRNQLRGRALSARKIQVPDSDADTIAREAPTGGESDPRGPAGDDRILSY